MEKKSTDLQHVVFETEEAGRVEAMWSSLRLNGQDVPDGWHRYAVRGGDDGWEPCSIEPFVWVNHTADIITPVDLELDKHDRMLTIRDWWFDDEPFPAEGRGGADAARTTRAAPPAARGQLPSSGLQYPRMEYNESQEATDMTIDYSIKVTQCEPMPGYKLKVTCSDGATGIFEMSRYVERGMFKPLKDTQTFDRVRLTFGVPSWPGDIDIAAERVRSGMQII